ncbi:MAG: 2-amino-4-oxopentanoate thiolase subunit OrtA [Christensenellales bacterium]
MAKEGDWVRIHQIVLAPGERAPQVPEDTARVPLELWVKGWLQRDAEPGDEAEIATRSGRRLRGTLLAGQTAYTHSFGEPATALMHIADDLRARLFGGPDEG